MKSGKEAGRERTSVLPFKMPDSDSFQTEQPQNGPQGARDFVSGHMAKWLVERVIRVRQHHRFEKALAAITQMQSEQVREFGLDSEGPLALFACLAISVKRGGGRKSCEKMAAIGTGKTWKALAEFPERLRRMAAEIEIVNASPLFAPAMYIGTAKGQLFRKRFEQLPGILSYYAAGIDWRLQQIPRHWSQMFPPSSNGPSQMLVLLSYSVKIWTGRWHDTEVAELLNAAAIALDETRQFDALSIAQARSRFKKKKT